MESFMDWWLIYRTVSQLRDLTISIDPTSILYEKVFREANENIGFLEVMKR